MDEATKAKMLKLFNTAYFVAKKTMPFSSFVDLCALQSKNGVSLGTTYHNDHGCRDFCSSMSSVMKEDKASLVKNCHFMSFLCDGSTDVSNKELLLVYIRLLDSGAPRTFFAGVKEIEGPSATGEEISRFITAVLDECNEDWKQKMVSAGTDGANSMRGSHIGAVSLMKREIPHLVDVHCIAHKLELAFSDAVKEHTTLKEVRQLLQGVWKHYHYSSKEVRELRELADAMGEQPGKPPKADGSRWVPHLLRALDVLLRKNIKSIVLHFQHTSQAKTSSKEMQGRAISYDRKLRSFQFLLHAHLLWDIVEEISKVSLVFQRNSVSLAQAKTELSRATIALCKMKTRPADHLNTFLQEVNSGTASTYRDLALIRSQQSLHHFNSCKSDIVDDTVKFLRCRFNIFDTPLFRAMECLTNHKAWPQSEAHVHNFGEKEVVIVAQHFKVPLSLHDFNLQRAKDQWVRLLIPSTTSPAGYMHRLDEEAFWRQVFAGYAKEYRDILLLVELCLVLPLATACCERGFSCLGRLIVAATLQ